MGYEELDAAVKVQQDAAMRLHWHLSRAAAYPLGGFALGPPFEAEMLAAAAARADWYAAGDAIAIGIRKSPPKVSADAG